MSKLKEKLKERYDINVNGVMVCEDRHTQEPTSPYTSSDSIIFKWGVIPPNDCIERQIQVKNSEKSVKTRLELDKDNIESLSDIYNQTKSGWNSEFHPINKNFKKKIKELNEEYKDKTKDEYFSDKKFQILSTEYTELIPCVLISRKDGRNLSKEELENDHFGEVSSDGTICYSFRVDNPMIREMFYDSECINSNNDGEGIDEELQKGLDHRLKEHNEYLDYFYKSKGWTWIKLWFEKCENGDKKLLHSEYLDKIGKTLKEYHEEEQQRIEKEDEDYG